MRRTVVSTTQFHRGTACIDCLLAGCGEGYPMVQEGLASNGTAKMTTAARAAWEHKYGPIPDGKIICHDCDNRTCVNVEHLSLGTHAEKSRHKVLAGRARGNAKLLSSEVKQIIHRAASGERNVDLAREYGVTPRTIANIKSGRTWHGSCT
jgi:hypothetical protein